MIKTLTKHDGGLALILDPSILERLGIDEETELNVQTDGTALCITPADPARREDFESRLSQVMTEWHDVLQHLAE